MSTRADYYACKIMPWDKINKTMRVPGGLLRAQDFQQMLREGLLAANKPYDMSPGKCAYAEREAVITAIRRHRNMPDREDRAAGGAGAGHTAEKRVDQRKTGGDGKKWEPRDTDRGARKPWPPRDERKHRNDRDDRDKRDHRDDRGHRPASDVVAMSTSEYEARRRRRDRDDDRPPPDEAESSSDSDVDRVARRRRA